METQAEKNKHLSHEDIAARAYQIWDTSGRRAGAELEHWLQAEEELAADQTPKAGNRPTQSAQAKRAESRQNESDKRQTTRTQTSDRL